MYRTLELQSGAARHALLDTVMMTSEEEITAYYRRLAEFCSAFPDPRKGVRLQARLAGLRDMGGVIMHLEEGATLTDVALFEIKEFCLLGADVSALLREARVESVTVPDLGGVVALLDPDGMKVASFYVYDSYSDSLRELRNKLDGATGDDGERLIADIAAAEQQVRETLSATLRPYVAVLSEAATALTGTDILLAKATQAAKEGLVIPGISSDGRTSYQGLFHPQVRGELRARGRDFQPVDLVFGHDPVTIIGANMGGKTVVLQMAALVQYLFQFGFAVPARCARIDIKEEIMLCDADGGVPIEGLSSFGEEVVGINAALGQAKAGRRGLWLIDEPARTTNPVEGTALAAALLQVMARRAGDLIMTTHYNIANSPGQRFKVRGLTGGGMDYSLVRTQDSEVPREAIAVARSLGADKEWLDAANDYLNHETPQ